MAGGVCQPALYLALEGRTEVLERLVMVMQARGLSTRDMEKALAGLAGEGAPLLGCSTVSRITEPPQEGCEAFAQRGLAAQELVYLLADGHLGVAAPAGRAPQGVLVTWAVSGEGSKLPVCLSLGNQERYEGWLEHFREPVRWGLRRPLRVASGGAPGLVKPMETMWPEAERTRCWVHKMGKALERVPQQARPVLEPYLEAVRDGPDIEGAGGWWPRWWGGPGGSTPRPFAASGGAKGEAGTPAAAGRPQEA